jgi:superfamily II DNA or RNA helicase
MSSANVGLEPDDDVLEALDALEARDLPEIPASSLLAEAPRLSLRPRPYQRDALSGWLRAGARGVVVLPTGAGKTVVAMMAIEATAARTLVVVPTIELLRQWKTTLIERLGLPASDVGMIGGGCDEPRPITVITYQSASSPSRALRDVGLLVCDEVHHLPAPTYRAIPARVGAPCLLGLTATAEPTDSGAADLARYAGPEVYRKLPSELSRESHIASYVERRLYLDLGPEERARYDLLMANYRHYMSSRSGRTAAGPAAFEDLIRRAAVDPEARQALRSHHEARQICFNADAKIALVGELMERHREDRVIVFSEFNATVDRISRRFLVPSITYRTPARERRLILERFRAGCYSKLATGRVLNEGVDVPDANVAIVVSGSSTTREYVQRLGRVLRPKPRQAMLYELITRRTSEGRSAARRRPREK